MDIQTGRKPKGAGRPQRQSRGRAFISVCCCAALYLCSATALIRGQDEPLSTSAYIKMLDTADGQGISPRIEPYFVMILNPQELEYYNKLQGVEAKSDYIKFFWAANNPAPALLENDNLLNHIQRINYAKAHYIDDDPPFIDDRGRYFIKYGKPSGTYDDPGGSRRVGFLNPFNLRFVSNNYYGYKEWPQDRYNVPANSTWAYEKVSPNFVVHFVARGEQYVEVKSLSGILLTQRKAHRVWHLSDLYKRRVAISPILGEIGAEIELFESEILSSAGIEIASGSRNTRSSFKDNFDELLKGGEFLIVKAQKAVPARKFDQVHAQNKLSFFYQTYQFKTEEERTRLEADIYVPLNKNFPIKRNAAQLDTVHLEFGSVFRNHSFKELTRRNKSLRFISSWATRKKAPFAIQRIQFIVEPQRGDISLLVRDAGAQRNGVAKAGFEVKSFEGDSLMLSDIQFLGEATAEKLNYMPAIEKSGLQFTPYPFLEIDKRTPLFCYFEIYNLGGNIFSSYEISYSVRSDKQQKGIFQKLQSLFSKTNDSSVSLSHARPVVENDTEELVSIDLSNLPAGKYILEIAISEAGTDEIKAKMERELVVAK